MVKTFTSYEDALAAKQEGETISFFGRGRLVSGRIEPEPGGLPPVWFLVPAEATADEMRDIAFEMQHGKPMDGYQRWLIEKAKEQADA